MKAPEQIIIAHIVDHAGILIRSVMKMANLKGVTNLSTSHYRHVG